MSRLKLFLLSFSLLLVMAACRQTPTATPIPPTETNVSASATDTPDQVTPPTAVPPTTTPAPISLIDNPSANPYPKIIGRSPSANEELALDGTLEVYFDQPMKADVTLAAWRVVDDKGEAVEGEVSFPQPRILRFKPSSPLLANTSYHAQLAQTATSTTGESLLEGLTLTFNTITDLQVSQVSPSANAIEIAVDSAITVIFNRPVVPLLMSSDSTNLPNPLTITPEIAGTGEWVNTSVYIFRPDIGLRGSQEYQVTVNAGIVNDLSASGAQLAEDVRWSFTTTSPTLNTFELVGIVTNPNQNYQNLPRNPAFQFTFNQPMNAGNTQNAVSLTDPSGREVPLVFSWNEGELTQQLTVTPTQLLDYSTLYTLAVNETQAESITGGKLNRGFSWQATTVSAPAIVSTSPPNGGTLRQYNSFSIRFASPMTINSLQDRIIIEPPLSESRSTGYYSEWDWTFNYYGFAPSTEYTVRFLPGMTDIYGTEITEEQTITFTTEDAAPSANFHVPGGIGIFREAGEQDIFVTYRNVPNLDVALYTLSDQTTSALLNGALHSYNYTPSPDQLVWQENRLVDAGNNTLGYSRFALSQTESPAAPGLYFMTLDAPIQHSGAHLQGEVLAVINTNLTIKTTSTEAMLWLTDLETGDPLANVPVALYDRNFNLILRANTNEDGIIYQNNLDLLPGYEGNYMAIVEAPDLFGIAFSNWSDGVYPYNFGIYTDYSRTPGDAAIYVYTDRPLYRPGQTVSFKGIVRLDDDLDYSLPTAKEYLVQVIYLEEILYSQRLPISEFASFEGEFTLDEEAILGTYRIEVREADDTTNNYDSILARGIFDVAEYRKPLFYVEVDTTAPDVVDGDTIQATIDAQFFSGGSVVNGDVTWAVIANEYTFNPGGNLSRFSFTDFNYDSYYDYYGNYGSPTEILAEGIGTTNAQGLLEIEIPATLAESAGSQNFTIEANVVDSAGNIVSGRTTVTVHEAELYAGIRAEQRVATVNEPLNIEVAVVDWDANPVANQAVTVELVERRWSSVQEQDATGRIIWRSNVEEIFVGSQEGLLTNADGRLTTSFTAPQGGSYKAYVTVADNAGRTNTASTYLWVSGSEYIPWRRTNDNNFELIADADNYQPGDTAELLIASPFQGETYALVTVERGHIKQHEVIQLTSNSTVYRLPITSDMAPNVIVSVMIMKGSDESNPIPDFKVGMAQFTVELEEQELTVDITPNKELTSPGDTIEYTIKVTDYAGNPVEAEVSLSLADLAALSLSFRPAEPILGFFYSERWLSVQTGILLNRLMDRFNQNLPEEAFDQFAGGGGGKGGEQEFGIQSVRQNFKDTAYWSAQVQTDENGLATVSIELPDNLTTWRMDARAVTLDTKVGQATHDIQSTRPLMLRMQTPRFFVIGDQSQLGALLINTTDEDLETVVTLEATGITVLDSAMQTVQLPANNQLFVTWDIVVETVDRVDVVMSAQSGDYFDASRPPLGTLDNQGIPVYRFEVTEVVGTSGQLMEEGAVVESIGLPVFPDFELSEAQVNISIAPSLAAAMTDGLTYLEHYPHECTEQIISKFLPNVLTTRALQSAGISDPTLEAELAQQVNTALQRIYSRQRSDGGWSWWDGGTSNSLVTAYVVLGLIEAQEAGYEVSPGVINQAARFLNNRISRVDGLSGAYKFNRQAFILYVMSRADQPNAGLIEELYDQRTTLHIYARAYLAQAIYYMNPTDPRLQTLTDDFINDAIVSATGSHWEETATDYWNWNTDTRTTAIVLDTMAKLDPNNPIVVNAVRWLMAHRTDGRWRGTQETAWTLMGLTNWMVATGELQANYDYEIALNGELLASGTATAATLRDTLHLKVELADLFTDELNRLAIGRNDGPGNLYYTAHLQADLPVEQIDALSQGIIVSRSYYDPHDRQTPITEIDKGQTFIARVTVIAPHALHYVVVEDFLPAGLEAIDQSLATSQQIGTPSQYTADNFFEYGWGWWSFEHIELRDEKVVLSASYLPAGTYEYVYLVRATTTGTYRVIPPTAHEFYFPEVYGRGAGSLFTIR